MPSRPLLAVALALAAAAAARPQAAIAGRVLDEDGRPAPGAAVQLRWRVHPELPGLVGISLGDRGLETSRHFAGDDGRFAIPPPHRGPFLVVAETPGQRSAQRFPVMAGDAVELRLEPAFELGGVLLGAERQPLAATPVSLRPHFGTWSRLGSYRFPEQRATSLTDADGRFTLPFELGYLRQPHWGILMVVAASSGDWQTWVHDIVRPTESARDLVVPLRGGRVHGRVVDDLGRPVPGARVEDPGSPGDAVACDADGRYAIPAWAWRAIVVRAPGWAVAEIEPDRSTEGGVETRLQRGVRTRATLLDRNGEALAGARVLWALPRHGEAPVEWLETTDVHGVAACDGAPPGRRVLGFVEVGGTFLEFCSRVAGEDADLGAVRVDGERTVRGEVLDHHRAPIPHARVALRIGEPPFDAMPRVTYADRGGRFRFEAVPPGAGFVSAEAGAQGRATADFAAGERDARITLAMAEGLRVAGIVVDTDGEPVAGAWVTLVAGDADERDLPGPTLGLHSFCTLTDAEGRFAFGGLRRAGTWSVLCNYFREGAFCGGGGTAATGADDQLILTRELSR